tara:strand:- start:327 stop:476 length:150 start_codon:yes stop_codon:yes gene_type:complete
VKAILDSSDVIFQPIDELGVRQEAESADLYTEMINALGSDISSCSFKIN